MGPYLKNLRSHVGTQCLLLPGVRAIILDNRNQVLLQNRTDVNRWGLPAGAVELEETALEAIKREVMEETNLTIHHAEPMGLYSGPTQKFVYPNGDQIQGFAVVFIVRDWTGVPRADGVEGSEVRFWPLLQLPESLVEIYAQTLEDFKNYNGRFFLSNGKK